MSKRHNPLVVYSASSGPRPDLDLKLAGAITALVLEGMKPIRAAACCGVARSTWHRWCNQADQELEPYCQLIGMIRLAVDCFDGKLELDIAKSSDARLKLDLLKSRLRAEYGGGEEPKELTEQEMEKLSDAELERIAAGGKA